ncbi:hypothetical protein B0I35DRAFT_429234 [Stachybotrys elegans]|uniref:Uncharacterized protein n=1 Tax=Stachybotrys elegans TaxID=80388 RepID=A0A8K0SUW0_9HYPO|nr:hypothetical protein B0I35DRAFT_429234 [Stachybotrys elegans]
MASPWTEGRGCPSKSRAVPIVNGPRGYSFTQFAELKPGSRFSFFPPSLTPFVTRPRLVPAPFLSFFPSCEPLPCWGRTNKLGKPTQGDHIIGLRNRLFAYLVSLSHLKQVGRTAERMFAIRDEPRQLNPSHHVAIFVWSLVHQTPSQSSSSPNPCLAFSCVSSFLAVVSPSVPALVL